MRPCKLGVLPRFAGVPSSRISGYLRKYLITRRIQPKFGLSLKADLEF
jgi:hypothetical protein